MNNLKRYGLGSVYLCAPRGNAAIKGPGIVECKDGKFYSAAEVDDFLESIGAGGVSGRITGKTLEQHRADFETAYAKLHQPDEPVYLSQSPVIYSQAGLGPLYNNDFTQHAWEIWALARGITTLE